MTRAPTAFIVRLERTDGRVRSVLAKCPSCSRLHRHRWPVRGPVSPTCGTQRSYLVEVWRPEPTPVDLP